MSTHVELIEGEDLFLLARPMTPHGVTLYSADIATATMTIFDVNGSATGTAKALTAGDDPSSSDYAECMFSTLQDDDWWDQSGGYTFWNRVQQTTDYTFVGGGSYRVEVTLAAGHSAPTWPNMNDYGDIKLVWLVSCVPVAG